MNYNYHNLDAVKWC